MSNSDVHGPDVVVALARARARVFQDLRGQGAADRQRELLDKAHDLLLAEEILGRYGVASPAFLHEKKDHLISELTQSAPVERQRALLDEIHDLLLVEEIIDRYRDELRAVPEPSPRSPVASENGWDVLGEFVRLIRGGIIRDDTGGEEVFVPEAVVRGEAIRHGDLVGARQKGISDRGAIQYFFQVVERRESPESSGRIAFTALLQDVGGVWGAYSDEEEIFVSVPDADVHSLALSEGDLVEIAYEDGHPARARVAWKYDPAEAYNIISQKQKAKKRKDRPEQGPLDMPLQGRQVLVVGADAYKESFKRMFERMGASFNWESGFMVGKFLESKINRADMVVIVTEAMKHKMPDIEDACKRLSKPYVYAPSRGATGAVREVLRKFELLES